MVLKGGIKNAENLADVICTRPLAERDEDGAEEGGGGGGAEAGRADHEVAGGEEVGVAGAVVVQQLQDGVVDPGLALRKVLLRRAGWEGK